MTAYQPVRVFVSYSHDSESHKDRVLELANRLRREGLDAILDRYVANPTDGWPRWMEQQLAQADFVLVICTETYRRRFEGREVPGKGIGATWESLVINQALYEASTRNSKLVPAFFDGEDNDHVPVVLRPYTRYSLPSQYTGLYRYLTAQPEVRPPEVGTVRTFSTVDPTVTKVPVQVEPLAVKSEGLPPRGQVEQPDETAPRNAAPVAAARATPSGQGATVLSPTATPALNTSPDRAASLASGPTPERATAPTMRTPIPEVRSSSPDSPNSMPELRAVVQTPLPATPRPLNAFTPTSDTGTAARSGIRRRLLLSVAWVLGLVTLLAVAMAVAWQFFAGTAVIPAGTSETCACDEHPNCDICNSGRERLPGACADAIPSSRMYRLRLAGVSLFDRKTAKKFMPGPQETVCVQQPGSAPVCVKISDAMSSPVLGLVRIDTLSKEPGIDVRFPRGSQPEFQLPGMRMSRKLTSFSNRALCYGAELYSNDGTPIVRFFLENP